MASLHVLDRLSSVLLGRAGIIGAGAVAAVMALRSLGMFHRTCTAPLNTSTTTSAPESSLGACIVILGGSRGLGYALAREFLRYGDRVIITSRSVETARAAAKRLADAEPGAICIGCVCDVTDAASCRSVAELARQRFGRVDVWVNNAAVSSKHSAPLATFGDSPGKQQEASQLLRTNLVGAVHGYIAAAALMQAQPGRGGHVFFVDGRGGDGSATPLTALYGCSKAGVQQLYRTLVAESASQPKLAVHTVQPGMMITPLLVDKETAIPRRHIKVNDPTVRNVQIFNILAEEPATPAQWLVPRMRAVVASNGATVRSGLELKYLTPLGAIGRFLSAPWRRNRLINEATGELAVETSGGAQLRAS